MGRLVVVTGIGHAATKWLAMVLNRPEQSVRFEHEPLMHLAQPNWVRARRGELRGAGDKFFNRYWPHVGRQLKQFRIYGDSMSWEPLGLGMLNGKITVDRVIFLVRHGVPQLHSVYEKSLFRQHERGSWLYSVYLRKYWELAGSPPPDWLRRSRWEMLCLWWNTNVFMPGIVRKWLPRAIVEVQRMEDLTGNASMLARFCHSFGLRFDSTTLRTLQHKDMNRKVEGNRSAAALWSKWSQSQRGAFKRLCGAGMEALGYRMP